MSDSWFDDRVNPLLDKLKTLKERHETNKAAKGEAEVRIGKIKSATRVKDRHLFLVVWANGDRSVRNEYRSLRDKVKLCRQKIAGFPRAWQRGLDELDQAIAEDLEQNNPAYRGIVTEQRELRRKRDVCRDALSLVVRASGNIARVSASLHVEPKGRAAVAAAKSKPGELSAQLKVVREKVNQIHGIGASRGLVEKLNMTFLGAEVSPDKRKKQLDDAVSTLKEVARKVEASGDKFEKRMRELEKDRVHMVRTKRDRLLSLHGLT